jgi:hypothetical protein
MLSLETFGVGAAPAENIQMAACPGGSGQCQIATAVTQGMIFNKLTQLTATPASAGEAAGFPGVGTPNVLFFKAIPKTDPRQPDALSIIQAGVGQAPGSRVAVDLRNALLSGPPGFFYVMLMAPPGGSPPPASLVAGAGSDFALVNIESAPVFGPSDTTEAGPEKKEKTVPVAIGAVVGAGSGGLFFGVPGAVGGAVAGGLLANWLVS